MFMLVTHCTDLKSHTKNLNMNISEIEDTHEDEFRGDECQPEI
jgi:hypothetical protein